MSKKAIALASLVGLLTVGVPAAIAAPAHAHAARTVKVVISGTNKGGDVSDGRLTGTGRFTATGAIVDKGKCLAYRTQKANLITLRFVSVGKKGTLTFTVRINTILGISRWTISSGTRAYKALHGKGVERENADYTVSTLTGTVWS